ncbi:MAG: lytic murein transglycosylase [Humidesulfovibrio sp.]|nr:lytic murein transglycosylase [Humidesulfovibrio sp.]
MLPVTAQAQTQPPGPDVWTPLTRRLVSDGFDQASLAALFSRAEVRFDPLIMARKMNALLEVKLSARKPKPEAPELYISYLNPFLLMQARSFLDTQRTALREARVRFSVPEEILTALLLVETKLGRNVGSKSALATLASMALAGDFSLVAPHIERRDLTPELSLWLRWRTAQKAAWAYKELKALLVYAKNAGFDPASIPGSVYGAIGICQFMPSNALRYGMDLNGDGRVDLFSPSDAVLSTARFLSANGWRPNLSREGQMAVLYRYNHSQSYTRTIMAVADRLRDAESPPEADTAGW